MPPAFPLSINFPWPMPLSMRPRSPMPPKCGRPMGISRDCRTCGSSKKIEAVHSCCIFVIGNWPEGRTHPERSQIRQDFDLIFVFYYLALRSFVFDNSIMIYHRTFSNYLRKTVL